MEALKKAEQAKQGTQDAPTAGIELQLEPIDSSGPAGEAAESADAATAAESTGEAKPAEGKTLPQLPTQLEVLDPQFIAHAEAGKRAATQEKPQPQPQQPPPSAAARPASPPPFAQPTRPGREPATGPVPARPPRPATASGPAPDADRAAAQQVFSAKQPERSRKGFAIAVGALIVLGLGGIGGYFWWQLQPKSGLIAARPAATASLARPLAAPPVAAAPAPPAAATQAAPAAQRQAPPIDDEDEDAGTPPPSRAARSAAQAATVPADAQSPIRISKSRLQANPAIERAFEAMNAGDLATAQGEYERVLRDEPKNAEALLGMAAIAVRRGDAAGADEWYLKTLEADPKDATAQAGLIGLRGHSDPLAQESRLKSLIAAQPDVPALHFALGNVYARQARWNEAQQAYFKAFSASPDNPDYLFNLAVSLDHLRQGRLAAQYYDQALAAAAQRPAGFDKAQAAARLRELRP